MSGRASGAGGPADARTADRVDDSPADDRRTAARAAAPRGATAGPVVLIADDDRDAPVILQRRLAHDGYAVVVAGTGDAAMLLARSMRPAVVVSELYLTCGDCPCLLHALRKDAELRRIPLLAYTAFAFTVDRGWAAQARVELFVRKPAPLADLRAAVERLAGPPYRARHA